MSRAMKDLRPLGRLLRETKGAVLVYTAILLPIFVGFAALGLDVALWHLDKRRTQTIADSAVWAAGLEYIQNNGNQSLSGTEFRDRVRAAANKVAVLNGLRATGDTLTLNAPPLYGEFAGNTKALEAIVTRPLPLFLSILVSESAKTVASRAVVLIVNPAPYCIIALNDELNGTLTLAGSAQVHLNCGVYSNSPGDFGIQSNGSPCLWATTIEVVGAAGPGCYFDTAGNTMEPVENVAQLQDPLANLPDPTVGACTYQNKVTVAGSRTATLQPGVYCGGLDITTSGQVTFAPGVYKFKGGNVTINGGANIVGSGVTWYVADQGNTTSNITINGGATVNLSAPTSGTYQGILIFQSHTVTNASIKLNGGSAMNLTGITYAPNTQVEFTGSSAANNVGFGIIADTVRFAGNSDLKALTYDSNSPTFSPFLDLGQLSMVE